MLYWLIFIVEVIMTIYDLEQAVVFNHYCTMDTFWENVGKDKQKVVDAVHKAKNEVALNRIITRYI